MIGIEVVHNTYDSWVPHIAGVNFDNITSMKFLWQNNALISVKYGLELLNGQLL